MSAKILIPLGGFLKPQVWYDSDSDGSGDSETLFDIDIPVRIDLPVELGPVFFPRPDQTTVVSLEDVDLGVADWRQLAGKKILFPDDLESDAAIYLATIHNPVQLIQIEFGTVGEQSIQATIDLEFDFRYVNPRPSEMERSFQVHWEIEFKIVSEP